MKKLSLIAAMLIVLTLSACGQKTQTTPPAEEQTNQTTTTPDQMTSTPNQGDRNPTAEELGRTETMELEFMSGDQKETVPATLYIGQGYSLYVPDSGWRLEKDVDDGIPEEVWESTLNNDVEFAVSHYSGISASEAVTAFLNDHDDYVFQDLQSGGEVKEPLIGVDDDGDVLKFITREGNGTAYIVSWEYRQGAENFDAQLEQIVRTFEVM